MFLKKFGPLFTSTHIKINKRIYYLQFIYCIHNYSLYSKPIDDETNKKIIFHTW